jgi:hypothetical protein
MLYTVKSSSMYFWPSYTIQSLSVIQADSHFENMNKMDNLCEMNMRSTSHGQLATQRPSDLMLQSHFDIISVYKMSS